MAVGSGIGASVMIGAEPSYGTFGTPTRAYELQKESVKFAPKRMNTLGIYAGGLLDRSSQRHQTGRDVKGAVDGWVFQKGMGLWLAHAMGSTAVPVQQGATAAYLQTHTLGDNRGLSLTYQKGVPDTLGVVHPYTYLGCKIDDAKFACVKDGLLTASFTLDGRDCSEAQSLTTPVYQTGNGDFGFEQGVFQIGALGSEATQFVEGFDVSFKRSMKVDRYPLDGSGLKAEPIINGRYNITGSIDTQYVTKAAFVDMFVADTPQSIVITFTGPLIASTYSYSFSIHLPCVRWTADHPDISGPDIVAPKMTFEAMYDDTNLPYITYQSTDVTL